MSVNLRAELDQSLLAKAHDPQAEIARLGADDDRATRIELFQLPG